LRQAAKIQLKELPEGFISSLGEEIVCSIFKHTVLSDSGIFVLALNCENNRVIGYALGVTNIKKFYIEYIFKRLFVALHYFLPAIWKSGKIKKTLESLRYPAIKGAHYNISKWAQLIDIAVERDFHGKGIGAGLFKALTDAFRVKGISTFIIPSSEGLTRAHAFYKKMGAFKVDSIQLHAGQKTKIFQYIIEENK
jgi:GNAT superfamily N-acetyltransferase